MVYLHFYTKNVNNNDDTPKKNDDRQMRHMSSLSWDWSRPVWLILVLRPARSAHPRSEVYAEHN